MKKKGRPIDLSGINPEKLQAWINQDRTRKDAIKCQSLISLTKGVSVTNVCKVLGVTRETVSQWRRRLRKEGIKFLERLSNQGRKSQLTESMKRLIKSHVLKSPNKSGYQQALWDGKLVCKLVKDQKGLVISVRTAQYWLKKIGFSWQRPRKRFKRANKKEKQEFKDAIKKNSSVNGQTN